MYNKFDGQSGHLTFIVWMSVINHNYLMTSSRNAKLKIQTLQILMNIDFKFHKHLSSCSFAGDSNNKLNLTGGKRAMLHYV